MIDETQYDFIPLFSHMRFLIEYEYKNLVVNKKSYGFETVGIQICEHVARCVGSYDSKYCGSNALSMNYENFLSTYGLEDKARLDYW